jgi:hypothetical protein
MEVFIKYKLYVCIEKNILCNSSLKGNVICGSNTFEFMNMLIISRNKFTSWEVGHELKRDSKRILRKDKNKSKI